MTFGNKVPDKTVLNNVTRKLSQKCNGSTRISATVRGGDATITGIDQTRIRAQADRSMRRSGAGRQPCDRSTAGRREEKTDQLITPNESRRSGPEMLPTQVVARSGDTEFAGFENQDIAMVRLEGNPLSPGFAGGVAVVYDYDVGRKLTLPHRAILQSDVQSECDRIDDALEQSKLDLKRVEQIANGESKLVDAAALLSAHAAMACEITASVKQQIECDLVSVEQALDSVIRDWVSRFQQLDNAYLRQREQDVRDVGQRMTRNLAGCYPLEQGVAAARFRDRGPRTTSIRGGCNWSAAVWLRSFPSTEES